MAFISQTLRSQVLSQEMHLDIYLPNDYGNKVSMTKPQGILYFLHGFGRSGKYIKELTAISRYARDNQLAVVFVDAPQGWYSDMYCGFNYLTYITEELPTLLENIYGLKFPREKTFLSGLSMGGYGTWELGCIHPEWFAAIMPVCGGGCPGLSAKLKNVPVRTFHGLQDTRVDPIESLQMAKAINRFGGHAELILFPEFKHNCWDAVYTTEDNYDWLFSHTLSSDGEEIEALHGEKYG